MQINPSDVHSGAIVSKGSEAAQYNGKLMTQTGAIRCDLCGHISFHRVSGHTFKQGPSFSFSSSSPDLLALLLHHYPCASRPS